MTLSEKLTKIYDIKGDIKDAIESKGGTISGDFETYPQAIEDIPTGGGGEGMDPKDCVDLNLYLSGDWYGDVVADYPLSDEYTKYLYANRPLTSYTNSSPINSYINDRAFAYCENLKTVDIDYLARTQSYCFEGCTSLETFTASKMDGMIIGPYTFSGCTSLRSIDVLRVASINGSAFYNCVSLEELDFPYITTFQASTFAFDSTAEFPEGAHTTVNLPLVTSVGSGAFKYCKSITELSFPSITAITSTSFVYMDNLRKVTLSGLTSYGGASSNGSFTPLAYSPNVEVLDLGAGVGTVRYLTYYNASNPSTGRIKNLIVRKTTPPTLYAVACMSPVTNIYVPDDSVEAYKSATNWSNASVVDKIKPLSEYVEEDDE